jgi:hypothetical protein
MTTFQRVQTMATTSQSLRRQPPLPPAGIVPVISSRSTLR